MDNFGFSENNIQHLIIRYLDGTASDKEILQLQDWLIASPDNMSLFQQIRNCWLKAGNGYYNVEQAWQELNCRIEKQHFGKQTYPWIKVLGYAAAIALLFFVGYYSIQHEKSQELLSLEHREKIEPGSPKAVLLLLGSNEEIELNTYSDDTTFRGNSCFKKEGNTLIYHRNRDSIRQDEQNRLITPRGGEYSIVLSDGTKVWLNSESELTYPVQFTGNERKVYLKGEGYFVVTKQAGQSFVVCVDNACITVLGTEFNVRSYKEERLAATLVKGSVLVAHQEKECKLMPGQQAVVDEDGIQVREVETMLYTAWKDGYFVYRETALEDILKELSRWYDFSYFYQNPDLKDLILTAKLRKFDSVEEVFEILKGIGCFDFVVKGKTVTVIAK